MPEPLTGVCRIMRIVDGVPTPVRIDRAKYDGAVHILAGEDAPRGAGAVPPVEDETRFLTVPVPAAAVAVPNVPLMAPTPPKPGAAVPTAPAMTPAATAPLPVIDKSVPRTVRKDGDGKWYLFVGDEKTHPNGYEIRADLIEIAKLHKYTVTNEHEAAPVKA